MKSGRVLREGASGQAVMWTLPSPTSARKKDRLKKIRPAGVGGPAGKWGRSWRTGASESFGQFHTELDGVRMIALHTLQLMTAAEHAVQFVDK